MTYRIKNGEKNMTDSICKRVSKNNSKKARERSEKLIKEVRKYLKKKYKFDSRLVGSSKRNTIVQVNGKPYDLDYQCILTKNSKKLNELPTVIKNDFFEAFKLKKSKNEKVQNSTTAVTVEHYNNEKLEFSFDFVIIKDKDNPTQIIRRNNKSETPQVNEFTWNELPNSDEVFKKFNNFSGDQKRVVCDRTIENKCKEKQKEESDSSKISSCKLFHMEVNNYFQELHK
jgi:hypothetical protein